MNRKLKIGGTGRSGVTVVHEDGEPIAIFLPAGAGTDPRAFVDAVKAADKAHAAALTAPDWIRSTPAKPHSYRAGDRVTHNGQVWEARIFHTYGVLEPGSRSAETFDAGGPVWTLITAPAIETPGAAEASAERGIYPAWVKSELDGTKDGWYEKGDRVVHNGKVWEATTTLSNGLFEPGGDHAAMLRWDQKNGPAWKLIGPAEATHEPLSFKTSAVPGLDSVLAAIEKLDGPRLTPDALNDVLKEVSPEELSAKLDTAMAAPPPKPNPGETFTDYMRPVSETQGLPKGITEILTGMAGSVDTGERFPGRRDDEVRIRSFGTVDELLEAIGAKESDEDADDCDCGICMLRRHWYTADGTLRDGRSLTALIRGMAIVTRKGSDDQEVETAARRVAARLYIDATSTGNTTGIVGVELPDGLDQKAVLAAVGIKMAGFSNVEQVTAH